MKALVITTTPPDATTENQTGSTNWTLRLLRLLDRHHEITLLAPPPFADPFLKKAEFSQIECPPDDRSNKCSRFIKSLRWGIYPSMWHQRSSKIDAYLSQAKNGSFDVCWLLDDYAGMYLRELPKELPVVFCRHFVLNMGLPEKSPELGLISALKLKWRKRVAKAFDRWTTQWSSITITGTKESRKNLLAFEPHANVIYFPTKSNRLPQPVPRATIESSTRKDGRITAVFLGDMTFPRNEEAIQWLVEEVLPTLDPKQRAAFHFKLIGRKNESFHPTPPSECSIEFTGFVKDLTSTIAEAQCAVIPVWGGNGVRIKTLTLLGSGLPAVSTLDGVEGLPVKSNRDVIIANTIPEFADGLKRILEKETRKKLWKSSKQTMSDFLSDNDDAERIYEISREALTGNGKQG